MRPALTPSALARRSLSGFVAVASVPVLFIGCGRSLSQSAARELVQPHILLEYGLIVPKTAEVTWRRSPGYENVLLADSVGLVSATHTGALLGQYYGLRSTIRKPDMGDKFTVSLTGKGKASEYWDGDSDFYFATARNTLDEILEITQNPQGQYTVLFSFVENQTPIGKEVMAAARTAGGYWTVDGARYRGKAIVIYDTFLKRYVVRDLSRSPWEREAWRPSIWLDQQGTKTAIRHGST